MTGNLLKKSSGFILLCSISLLMLVMTGCQEAKLKTVIGVANKQCPIDMGASVRSPASSTTGIT
mgnify:CR=1 FL=1